jgi:oxygen-independent coproporphyrinogen-3 oxidase
MIFALIASRVLSCFFFTIMGGQGWSLLAHIFWPNRGVMKNKIGIYVHIPFCMAKCRYCDFFSIPVARGSVDESGYASALISQLESELDIFPIEGREVGSIYFGGGTPSMLSPDFFRSMLDGLAEKFHIVPEAEISCEVNPATAEAAWFSELRSAGINRVSIGVQSFNERNLKILGRIHTPLDAMRAIAQAQDAGFSNLSTDIIYSIPGTSMADLEEDLRLLMMFFPAHVSAYCLNVEEGTQLQKKVLSGELKLPSEEEQLKQMRMISRMLRRVGWNRYEISNYAKPEMESRHNVNYWEYGEYLGLGPSAASFLMGVKNSFGVRRCVSREIGKYMKGEFLSSEESIHKKQGALEFMFMGLRMTRGIELSRFCEIFGGSVDDFYSETLSSLADRGLILRDEKRIALTDRGIEISDQIFSEFAM